MRRIKKLCGLPLPIQLRILSSIDDSELEEISTATYAYKLHIDITYNPHAYIYNSEEHKKRYKCIIKLMKQKLKKHSRKVFYIENMLRTPYSNYTQLYKQEIRLDLDKELHRIYSLRKIGKSKYQISIDEVNQQIMKLIDILRGICVTTYRINKKKILSSRLWSVIMGLIKINTAQSYKLCMRYIYFAKVSYYKSQRNLDIARLECGFNLHIDSITIPFLKKYESSADNHTLYEHRLYLRILKSKNQLPPHVLKYMWATPRPPSRELCYLDYKFIEYVLSDNASYGFLPLSPSYNMTENIIYSAQFSNISISYSHSQIKGFKSMMSDRLRT